MSGIINCGSEIREAMEIICVNNSVGGHSDELTWLISIHLISSRICFDNHTVSVKDENGISC